MNKYQKLLQEIETEKELQGNLHRDSKVLIVDGMNLFIRTFSAIPTLNEDGQHIGGLSGFLQSLAATVRMVNPTRVVVVFDGKGGSLRRKKIYSNINIHYQLINNEKNHYNLCSHIYDCKHVCTSTTKNELPSGN